MCLNFFTLSNGTQNASTINYVHYVKCYIIGTHKVFSSRANKHVTQHKSLHTRKS